MPDKAIVVLNIGGRALDEKSRLSFVAAADRWVCDFVEIKSPLVPKVHHFWQKVYAIEQLTGYRQVVQLDADMLIRRNAPSPFDVVPETHVGVVSARQYYIPDERNLRLNAIELWAKRMDVDPIEDERHLNGGFILYSPRHHLNLFREAQAVAQRWNHDPSLMPEQSVLSLLLVHRKIPTVWLPFTWNVCKATLPVRPDVTWPQMNGYIYHFNVGGKQQALKKVWWRHDGYTPKLFGRAQAIAERMKDKPSVLGVEVGVSRGKNAAALLHLLPQLSLWLVDTWHAHASRSYKGTGDKEAFRTEDEQSVIFQECMWRVRRHWPRIHFLQCDSVRAAGLFDDLSLDFVFIDANHSYEGCKADIHAWAPKVKPGGYLCGHDFGYFPGIKSAVEHFARAQNLELETDRDLTWFLRL